MTRWMLAICSDVIPKLDGHFVLFEPMRAIGLCSIARSAVFHAATRIKSANAEFVMNQNWNSPHEREMGLIVGAPIPVMLGLG